MVTKNHPRYSKPDYYFGASFISLLVVLAICIVSLFGWLFGSSIFATIAGISGVVSFILIISTIILAHRR